MEISYLFWNYNEKLKKFKIAIFETKKRKSDEDITKFRNFTIFNNFYFLMWIGNKILCTLRKIIEIRPTVPEISYFE